MWFKENIEEFEHLEHEMISNEITKSLEMQLDLLWC
jgi:hypothetical protein